MGSIRIRQFGGIKPRDKRGEGESSRASIARDVKLWHGSLQPWRYPAVTTELSPDAVGCIKEMYMTDCCIISSTKECANFGEIETNCGRVFSTGHMDWPAYTHVPSCAQSCGDHREDVVWHRLGVPRPPNRLTLTGYTYGSNDSGTLISKNRNVDLEMRAYAFSFVNAYGEESEMSPPSVVINTAQDSECTLQFSVPPLDTGYEDPEFIRIYRAGSGFSGENAQMSTAEFFYVEDIPFRTGNFTHLDDVDTANMDEVNMSECHKPPLANLENLTVTENGVLVASEGKNVWFSEPWRPHAWSCYMNLDECVKGIAVQGPNIYVLTTGTPYIISSNVPADDCKCCRDIVKVRMPAPLLCKRSLVKTANGVMYATDTGLAQISGTSLQIDTHTFMAEDDWQKWYPHDLIGAYYNGRYFGFNKERGFIWDVNEGAFSDTYLGESGKFTELSLTPTSVYVTEHNKLLMTMNEGDNTQNIYTWDESDTYMPYTWRTRLNIEGGLKNFSAMKIVFEDWLRTRKSPTSVTVRLYADDKIVFARNVNCSKPFRLPKGYDALNYEIEIEGTESVMEIHMATSMQELTLINNA